MSQILAGKVAVVTGGSSGIGRAAALAFAEAGAKVAIGARRAAQSLDTVRLITDEGGQAFFVETDVKQPESIEHLMQTAMDRWGRLDCAFNNAGIAGAGMIPLADYPVDVWHEVIQVNLTGVFLSMKYEIPRMLASGGGTIVNMSSIAGLTGGQIGAPYFASKHGVVGMTKAAALEYAPRGIRVNAVCPAVIRTEMSDELFGAPEVERMVLGLHPIGRFGSADEVAEAVVWLCSEQSSFVTGVALPIDGGFLAR